MIDQCAIETIQRKCSRVKAPDNKLSKIRANLKQRTNDVESLKPKRKNLTDKSKNKGKKNFLVAKKTYKKQ